MLKPKKLLLLSLLILPILLFSACAQKKEINIDNSEVLTNQGNNAVNTNDQNTNTNPRHIVMMGRSVMNGWFDHWGWDGESPMQLDRYTLEYHELAAPPEITESVKRNMQALSDNQKDIVFFKLCFEDFLGDDQAEQNLETNKKIIEDVYDIVVNQYGAELIIGNALPKVLGDTDIYLVWNHQQFISWLNEFWRDHPDHLTVFDMYNPLTNDLGALKEEYAVSKDDSHLNDSAYSILDEKFFDMLDSIY